MIDFLFLIILFDTLLFLIHKLNPLRSNQGTLITIIPRSLNLRTFNDDYSIPFIAKVNKFY